jgi:hypothetical protein
MKTAILKDGFRRLTVKQKVMIAAPVALIASMYLAFQGFSLMLGASRGYVAGFILYWIFWCIGLPVILLGVSGVASLYSQRSPKLGNKPWRTVLIISWPIVLPFATIFLPKILTTGLSAIAVSVVLGVVIGITEEIFWRGMFAKLFPNNFWAGSIYPSITFGLWHLAPLSVQGANDPGGAFSFVFVSVLLGLSWSYYAQKTGSIRWCTAAHVINDSLGLAGIKWVPMLLTFV